MRRYLAWPALLLAAVVSPAGALHMDRSAGPVEAAPEARPFFAGERAEYQVKLGGAAIGKGVMEVLGIVDVGGYDTYHTRLRLSGGLPFARVDDKFESWIDVDGLFSRRFKQDQKELTFKRRRTYEFDPEGKTYRRLDNGEVGSLPTDQPLDEVSIIYFVRTLPLNVGDTYTIARYFKGDGNPVVIKVLRKQTVTVPAGTFETIVVQPIIKTDGLFGEGGRAELYFSDDASRTLIQMKSRVPVVGSLSLHLRSYLPGG